MAMTIGTVFLNDIREFVRDVCAGLICVFAWHLFCIGDKAEHCQPQLGRMFSTLEDWDVGCIFQNPLAETDHPKVQALWDAQHFGDENAKVFGSNGKDLRIVGTFNDWWTDESSQMTWNSKENQYEHDITYHRLKGLGEFAVFAGRQLGGCRCRTLCATRFEGS